MLWEGACWALLMRLVEVGVEDEAGRRKHASNTRSGPQGRSAFLAVRSPFAANFRHFPAVFPRLSTMHVPAAAGATI